MPWSPIAKFVTNCGNLSQTSRSIGTLKKTLAWFGLTFGRLLDAAAESVMRTSNCHSGVVQLAFTSAVTNNGH